MIHQVWRLSEPGDGNLGLACTERGLLLGRTPLIERRNGRFAVRERSEIERPLSRADQAELPTERLMKGLATVASALNANDPGLARIAAVHLRIPDLPSLTARDDMEAADILIKSADWNPALHPRTGTAPSPGWFAPSGTEQPSPARVAQSDARGRRASPTGKNESTIRHSSEDFQENPSLIVSIADNQRQNKQARDVAVILKMTKRKRTSFTGEYQAKGMTTTKFLKSAERLLATNEYDCHEIDAASSRPVQAAARPVRLERRWRRREHADTGIRRAAHHRQGAESPESKEIRTGSAAFCTPARHSQGRLASLDTIKISVSDGSCDSESFDWRQPDECLRDLDGQRLVSVGGGALPNSWKFAFDLGGVWSSGRRPSTRRPTTFGASTAGTTRRRIRASSSLCTTMER
jgi:hypothetical protein